MWISYSHASKFITLISNFITFVVILFEVVLEPTSYFKTSSSIRWVVTMEIKRLILYLKNLSLKDLSLSRNLIIIDCGFKCELNPKP